MVSIPDRDLGFFRLKIEGRAYSIAVSIPDRDLGFFRLHLVAVLGQQCIDVSIPDRDLGFFRLKEDLIERACQGVSIPDRDLGFFRQIEHCHSRPDLRFRFNP